MKGYRPFKGLHAILMVKTRRSLIVWLTLLSMFLIPALACNLPQRQVGGLGFPTSQAQNPSPELSFPAGEFTPAPGLTELPSSTSASLEPGEVLNPPQGLQTATPGAGTPELVLTPEPGEMLPPFIYISQPGDTLAGLAGRFGVSPDQVSPQQPSTGFLQPGQQLTIPNLIGEASLLQRRFTR